MANPNHVGKVVELAIDGRIYEIKDDAEFTMSGYERSEETGSKSIVFHRKPMPAVVKAEIALKPDISLEAIAGWEDVSVTATLDTGQTFTMNNAWNKLAPVAKTGFVPVELMANKAQEVR